MNPWDWYRGLRLRWKIALPAVLFFAIAIVLSPTENSDDGNDDEEPTPSPTAELVARSTAETPTQPPTPAETLVADATATATPAVPASIPTPAPTEQAPPTPAAATPLPATVQQPTIADTPSGIPAYDRDDWSHWSDDDRDCQNTRHEVLVEESLQAVTFKTASECQVGTGYWIGVYTNTAVTDASDLDVDHMIPLKNAHLSGAWTWSAAERKAYANDLSDSDHLVAVTASANRSKGAKGPDEWMPPDTSYWCEYAIDWIRIKNTWSLTVTPIEWAALESMLATCTDGTPSVTAPAGTATPTPAAAPTATPATPMPTAAPTATAAPATPMPTAAPTVASSGYPVGTRTGEPVLYDPFGPDRNCGDFPTWASAQDFFEAVGGPSSDAHGLDQGDRDGLACESLPGGP